MSAAAYTIVATPRGREIGLRRLGAGPPAVLLHESPRSSVALLPLAERLAGRFTVLALDNPGFGLSQPLPVARPDAADFADALAETFDALGLARAPVYGTHTGAVIAVEFGRRHPTRCAGVVVDGYPVFTPAEQEEAMASYLAPIRPDWEGTWLAWLWGRVRDQYAFFPWYRRGQGARLPRPVPPVEFLQQVVGDFLSAGDNYRPPYASAFRYDAAAPIAEMKVPVVFAARDDDLLFGHLDRLPPLPAKDRILRLGADRDAWGRAIGDALAAMKGATIAPSIDEAALPADLGGGPIHRRIVAAGRHRLMIRAAGGARPADGSAVVVLGAAPGGALDREALLPWLGRRAGFTLAIDFPGQGGSSQAEAGMSLDDLAETVEATLDRFSVRTIGLVALQAGAAAAARIAARGKVAVAALVAADPVPDAAAARAALAAHLVDIAPQIHGGHLAAAWYALRDSHIWKPWFERLPAAARKIGPDPDIPAMTADLVDWFRGGPSYVHVLRALLAEAPGPLLASVAAPTTIVAFAGDPDFADQRRRAQELGLAFAGSGRLAHELAFAVAAALERKA